MNSMDTVLVSVSSLCTTKCVLSRLAIALVLSVTMIFNVPQLSAPLPSPTLSGHSVSILIRLTVSRFISIDFPLLVSGPSILVGTDWFLFWSFLVTISELMVKGLVNFPVTKLVFSIGGDVSDRVPNKVFKSLKVSSILVGRLFNPIHSVVGTWFWT